MKRLRIYSLIGLLAQGGVTYFETVVAKQLFTEYNQSESFQTIGVNGLYGCVLGIVVFAAVIRLCLCFNMLIVPQNNYLQKVKHDRKVVFKNHIGFYISAFLLAIFPALMMIWQYATTVYGVFVFAYLFATVLTFLMLSLILYRPFLYPRIDDIIQSYSYFLALLYVTLFLPFSEQAKIIYFNGMSLLLIIAFIWFVLTKGLFLIPRGKLQFKEKIYQVSREHHSTFLRKYIVRKGMMPLHVSRKYGYFTMHTTYYTEKNIDIISKWKRGTEVRERYIICDVPFYEELLKAKLEYRIKATIIVITDGEQKFDMLSHLPEQYDIFVHGFLQYT